MKINLGFIFDLFRGVKQVKREVTDIRQTTQRTNEIEEGRYKTRGEWMKNVTIPQIVENVKITINEFGLYEKYGNILKMDIEELCLEIALCLDEESYTKIELKNAFDEGIACSTGVQLNKEMLDSFAEYYYTNFYSDQKQMEYHKEGKIKRAEND